MSPLPRRAVLFDLGGVVSVGLLSLLPLPIRREPVMALVLTSYGLAIFALAQKGDLGGALQLKGQGAKRLQDQALQLAAMKAAGTQAVIIAPDGRINFLEAQNVMAAGLTVDELRKLNLPAGVDITIKI